MLATYIPLGIAIMLEVLGTSALQASQQFTKPVPTILMGLCYLAAFYFLSLALRAIPVGIAYAIWSGMGVVLITLIGLYFFNQKIDMPAVIGLVLIVAGVIIINVFSKTISH